MEFATGEGPVANGVAVLEDDGPEDAVATVGTVHKLRGHGQVAALVANEVFVVRRKEGDGSAAETAGAAILVAEQLQPFPAVFDEFAPNGVQGLSAVPDVQATPPDKVLQRGRAMAAEVGSRQLDKGFLPGEGRLRRELIGHKGIGRLLRMQVPAAEEAGVFGQADVVGQPVVVHGDALIGQGRGEIGL